MFESRIENRPADANPTSRLTSLRTQLNRNRLIVLGALLGAALLAGGIVLREVWTSAAVAQAPRTPAPIPLRRSTSRTPRFLALKSATVDRRSMASRL